MSWLLELIFEMLTWKNYLKNILKSQSKFFKESQVPMWSHSIEHPVEHPVELLNKISFPEIFQNEERRISISSHVVHGIFVIGSKSNSK